MGSHVLPTLRNDLSSMNMSGRPVKLTGQCKHSNAHSEWEPSEWEAMSSPPLPVLNRHERTASQTHKPIASTATHSVVHTYTHHMQTRRQLILLTDLMLHRRQSGAATLTCIILTETKRKTRRDSKRDREP